VNSSPTHAHHRYVINFGERSEEECRREWPELMGIVEQKVKPGRMAQNREIRSRYWWRFGETCPALYAAISGFERVFAVCLHQQIWAIGSLPATQVFSHGIAVIAAEHFSWSALLQGRLNESWISLLSSSLEERIRYTPSDCFETLPFPAALLDANINDSVHDATRQSLEAIGELYHQFRAELMVANNEGLTSTYNRFHDPAETSPGLLELRRLHGEMDQAVLNAYSWSDVPTACGFGLDYLDTEDDAQLPDELQERIDIGDLFFWDANDALDFQGQLQAYGAISGRRKLPWRYRWPDSVRDDVLARLLALNAERYEEEQILGKKSGRAPRRHSRTKQSANVSLAPFPMPGEVQVDLFEPQIEQLELGR